MAEIQKVRIEVSARDTASAKLHGVSAATSGLGRQIKGLLPILGVAGLAIGFKKVIQEAANFETQLSNIATLISGDSTQAIKQFEEGINRLSKTIPKDPNELGAAAYQIVSAGISDTSKALQVLEQSGRLAVAGLGTTEEATDLLTSALNAFGKDASEAEAVSAILFNTVKQGKTTVAQLAQSFGQVAPVAAEMNVSLEELQAATAALTTTGLQTSVAQQQLKQAMASLLKPTQDAKDLFEKLGVESFKQLIDESGGLVNAFGELKGATEGNEEALAKAAGSVEGLNAILALTGAQSDAFRATMESTTEAGKSFDEAVQKQNETVNAQFQLLKNNLNVELKKMAVAILPILTEGIKNAILIFQEWVSWFETLADWLGTLIFKIGQAIDKFVEFKNKVGGGISNVGNAFRNLPANLGFATGGVVPGPIGAPVLATVHGGEQVIPARGSQRNSGTGGGGITVVVNNPFFLDERAGEKITETIMQRLREDMRI